MLCEQCVHLPSQAGRAPEDHSADFKRIRKELDEQHELLQQYATEKVRLAAAATEMVQYNIGRLDKDLISFAQELAENARDQQASGPQPPHL